jgi:hypothetical protein
MSRSNVSAILDQIDALPKKDRQQLEQELEERAEREWKQLATAARSHARRRGMTQARIDQAIERLRYARR